MKLLRQGLLTGRAGRAWFAMALAYVLLQWGRRQGLVSGWVDWYLADLLCLPLLLGFVLVIQRLVHGSSRWLLPRWHGFLAAVGYGLYFELLLPHFKATAVGDPLDALSYLLGWGLFEVLLNRAA